MSPLKVTIVICTHNREQWLDEALESIFRNTFVNKYNVELIIVESACFDNTAEIIQKYMGVEDSVEVKRYVESVPGRSRALNLALEHITGDLIALVDDDHIVSNNFLSFVVQAAKQNPDISGFCGRIVPMWDGDEPDWVHSTGPLAIRPFPIPNFDLGTKDRLIKETGFIPGAGNLILRKSLIDKVGFFKDTLGPKGHNLGGGEDIDYVVRALQLGERILYVPEILQHHQIDKERLRLRYLIKKAFQRHKVLPSVSKHKFQGKRIVNIPVYLFRQLGYHLLLAVIYPGIDHKRYHLVRIGCLTGEITGFFLEENVFVKVKKTLDWYLRRGGFFARKRLSAIYHPPLSKPIFIIGCSRSGTTVVYKTLSKSRYLTSLNKESHGMWEELHPAREKNWDSHELTEKDVRSSDRKTVTKFYYERLGCKRMVDKANQNCFRIPFLLSLFPDACFVWVKRGGPDNINSLIHGWSRPKEYGAWSEDLPDKVRVENGSFKTWCFFLFKGWRKYTESSIEDVCAGQWITANQAVLNSKPNVPASQWVEIYYEDILDDTVTTFQQVFLHLGIPFDDKMRDFCNNLVQNPINAFSKPRLDKWKEENPKKIEKILPDIQELMSKMGYDY